MKGFESTSDCDNFATLLVLGDLSSFALQSDSVLTGDTNASLCIITASFGKSAIQFRSSTSAKKSDSRRSSADKVDLEPIMMSFFFARVNETLIRRQSRKSSPI